MISVKSINIVILCFILISCGNSVSIKDENFQIELTTTKNEKHLDITYIPNSGFKLDSVLFITYTEYYKDIIKIYRNKIQINKGKYESKRIYTEIPGNIEIQISRFKEPSTSDNFLFILNKFEIEVNPEDELITLFFTDSIIIAESIFEKYLNDASYGLIAKILYTDFLIKNNISNIGDININSLLTKKLIKNDISNLNMISLLFLKMVNYDNDLIHTLNLNDLKGYDFSNNLSTLEYLLLRKIYSQIYSTRIKRDYNSLDFETNKFMLNVLNKNTNFIFMPNILRITDNIKENLKYDLRLGAILNEIVENSLQYYIKCDCEQIQEYYYNDLPVRYFMQYKSHPNIKFDDIMTLQLLFANCIKTDSWINLGYSNGYNLEFSYMIKYLIIKELIYNGNDSLALQQINEFITYSYVDNTHTSGAINMIHLLGCEINIKLNNFDEAKNLIHKLAKFRSPQLQETIEKYNVKAIENNVEIININDFTNYTNKLGKKTTLKSINTNKGALGLNSQKKYILLFFNEDCNACNISINDIIEGVREFDKKDDVYETIIVCDDVRKIQEEFPHEILAIEPVVLRKELNYYSKSGTFIIEDMKITYESINIPTNSKDFLDYLFNYMVTD
ncbi:MAG: hypothetical protein CVV22_12340 [Ignavibacteriae bacterium HGW-Ignavibacteriae-1]|jgi:hypothetical protein|nr:MAG: hypothetical protein CVV22_12340 [Ignavibacteriae bacterium HGW-Ignavibacteriae-1]